MMANPDHLAILEQGVETWNQWREENPELRPDLSEAPGNLISLPGANLKGVDLSGVDLSARKLTGMILAEPKKRQLPWNRQPEGPKLT
jgi:hypothetical protein